MIEPFVALVRRHAVDAVAFQGLAPSMSVWRDEDGGAVAYFDTGSAWVGAGGPVCPREARGVVARRFVDAGGRAGRRVSFFAVEDLDGFEGWGTVHLGDEPSMTPEEWALSLAKTRSLREQLRRARTKRVVAGIREASEVDIGRPLRAEINALFGRWLASRRIEPMAFLVAPDPFTLPRQHVYVVATVGRDTVGLLSAVPAYAGAGWLVEHLVCGPGAPNGTAETLLDTFHRSLVATGRGKDRVSLGLAPLSGETSSWHRLARTLARPLFDFEGLRRFKARLRPSVWQAVWLVTPPEQLRALALFDALSAFAGGGIVRFGVRSLLLHPRGLLCTLAGALVPWTSLLAWLDLAHHEQAVGYSRHALALWIPFNLVLALGLFGAAHRPAYRTLIALFFAALGAAGLSWIHLGAVGLGPSVGDSVLRMAAALAPTGGGATILLIAFQRARQLSRVRA